MKFTELLREKGIDPEGVLVLRHRPIEPELRKVFPLLAEEKPEVFNAFQRSHFENVERALARAKYVAAFIGQEAGKAVFVGLYRVDESKSITREEFLAIPENVQLKSFGMSDPDRSAMLWFDLELMDFYCNWKGKLVVKWPGPERAWWRWADRQRNQMEIHAITEESVFNTAMPEWNEIDLTWEQLKVIPSQLKSRLQEWRAVYYIFDTSDGKGYVGSAYGNDNLFGRWMNYALSGDGNNKLLKTRDPGKFRFSILERVSPDMGESDVIRLEVSWKQRLHARHPFGLNLN